jgi:hypothetical protein
MTTRPCNDVPISNYLPEDIMARKNSTRRAPQRFKHSVEDRMARRALAREVDRSYREEARMETRLDGRLVSITFTDPSFG